MYKIRDKKNPEFYLERGYATDVTEANHYVSVYLQNKSLSVIDIVGREKVHNLKSKNSSLRRENATQRFSSGEEYLEWKKFVGRKGPKLYQKEYWIQKGYSEQESVKMINLTGKKNTVRGRTYWKSQGLTDDEIDKKLKEVQTTRSKQQLVKKYGNSDATRMLQESSIFTISFWKKRGCSEEEAKKIVSKIQNTNAKKQRKCKEYWMATGLLEAEAIVAATTYSRLKSHWCLEYWLDKGYSRELAVKMVRDIQSKNGKLSIKGNVRRGYTSKLETMFADFVKSKLEGVNVSSEIVSGDKKIYPDILIGNLVVEIYGDFWHCNPVIFNKTDVNPVLNMTAEQKWESDSNRVSLLKSLGYKVLVIWESDLIRSGYDNCLTKIVSKLET